MMSSIQSMLEHYQPKTAEAYRNALKEIIQEIALYGMSKSRFFQKGAFYGGTALRIFYGLHRFSEDMDFSLMYPDPSFALSDYLPAVEEELSAVGLKMHVEQKNKTKVTDIQSAFIKGGTLIQVISIQQTDEILMFSVKRISSFSSSEFPIVIVGKSPLSAGLVRKQVPLLHPAA